MMEVNCSVKNCRNQESNKCTLQTVTISLDGDVHAKGVRDTLCSSFVPRM